MIELVHGAPATVAGNLALDAAMARQAGASGRSRHRFWWGSAPTVVLGALEQAEAAADTAACAALGVPVLRRCTGGGAVLQTSGVLNYALAVPALGRVDPEAGFRQGTTLVRAILDAFGVAAERRGVSDVAVGDRKISGNAQARRWQAVLVHGSLLVDLDLELAGCVLRHPPREPEYRRGRGHGAFLTSLRAQGIRAGPGRIERVAVAVARNLFGATQSVDITTFPKYT